MPTYRVTDPASGMTLRLTGDSPPTEQELEQIFAAQRISPDAEPQIADTTTIPGAGIIEPVAALATGAIAEPVAGLAGIAQTVMKGPESGAEAVRATREALTYRPRTEAGRHGLEVVGEALKPIAETMEQAERYLGDEVFDATNSPALAAAATTIPTAIIEAIGVAPGSMAIKGANRVKRAAKQGQIRRMIETAAPDIDHIKRASRAVYKELDRSGVTLRQKAYKGLANRVTQAVNKAGFDADLAPKTAAALRRIQADAGQAKTLSEIDNLRKIAQNAASSIDPADARLGGIIVDNIDQFLDKVTPTAFERGAVPISEIGPKYRIARELWGRARRSELINEAMLKAKDQATGLENGLRVQFRAILNNKKKSRFFKPDEIQAMRDVVRGTTPANIAKLIGRLGFSENQATNLIGTSIGIGAGAHIGGPAGAIAVPVIGQVSRKLAQKLTAKNARFADSVVRAGTNANKIVSSYMQNVPKKARSASELAELLVRPDIALEALAKSPNPLYREAADIAMGYRAMGATSAGIGAGVGAIRESTDEESE